MPPLELPLQSQSLELLTADCRRLIFPSDREFFSCRAALAAKDDLARLNFDGFSKGPFPVQSAIAASDPQSFANRLPVAFLQKFHSMYDFRGAVDGLNTEALKYGSFVGHVKWVTEEVSTEEYSGARSKKYPALIPCSLWDTYLDDSPAKLFAEGVHIGPGIVRAYQIKKDDLYLAAKRGSKDPDDMLGGWRPAEIKTIDGAIEKMGAKKDHIQVIRFDGDLVVPRSGKDSIYLPNVIVDVVESGETVIRLRFRDIPFNPYIVGHYHRDNIASPYSSSPLLKGVPIQQSAVWALKQWMACAALHALPPLRYDAYDPHYAATGGPDLYPGAKMPSNVNPDLLIVGDPGAIMSGYLALLQQYENETGVTAPRLGAQTKSHQTAFAIDQEVTRGMVRTVDYVSSNLHSALRSFLYMEYELAKQCGDETIYMPEYAGFVTANGKNLPETVEFDIAGSGAPIDERERRNNELAALQALIATTPAAQSAGFPAPDLHAVQEDIVRLGGKDPKRYFPTAPASGAADVASGVGGIPGGASPLAAIPGLAGSLPGSPG